MASAAPVASVAAAPISQAAPVPPRSATQPASGPPIGVEPRNTTL